MSAIVTVATAQSAATHSLSRRCRPAPHKRDFAFITPRETSPLTDSCLVHRHTGHSLPCPVTNLQLALHPGPLEGVDQASEALPGVCNQPEPGLYVARNVGNGFFYSVGERQSSITSAHYSGSYKALSNISH